jgi:GT2 family glycosyltransferase
MSRLYSVIISGYKDSAKVTLEKCLGLATSEEVGFEIVFLDNTPDGRLGPVAEELFRTVPTTASKTICLAHPVPGKAAIQNLGIGKAGGDICVFLDDDVLPAGDLLRQYDRGFSEYDRGAIQGRVELLFEHNSTVPAWLNERLRLDLAEMDFGRAIIPFEMGMTGANMAFKRELFDKYGFFDERLGPGRSGTLADQEYSERIRGGGETVLFWPGASVKHLIPPARLTVRSFASIYYDVGFSDYFLSKHMIRGGKLRLSLYTLRQSLLHAAKAIALAACRRRSDCIVQYCEIFKQYGYWKQAMMRRTEGG